MAWVLDKGALLPLYSINAPHIYVLMAEKNVVLVPENACFEMTCVRRTDCYIKTTLFSVTQVLFSEFSEVKIQVRP
jgi:hypothetical protein